MSEVMRFLPTGSLLRLVSEQLHDVVDALVAQVDAAPRRQVPVRVAKVGVVRAQLQLRHRVGDEVAFRVGLVGEQESGKLGLVEVDEAGVHGWVQDFGEPVVERLERVQRLHAEDDDGNGYDGGRHQRDYSRLPRAVVVLEYPPYYPLYLGVRHQLDLLFQENSLELEELADGFSAEPVKSHFV